MYVLTLPQQKGQQQIYLADKRLPHYYTVNPVEAKLFNWWLSAFIYPTKDKMHIKPI
jgi:hypothetical protein